MSRRVLATVLVVCTLAVTLFFVPMALLVRTQNRHTDLLELQRLSAIAVRSAPSAITEADRWQPPQDDLDHRYALYDTSGRRVTGDGPDAADAAVLDALGGTVAGAITAEEIVAATPLGAGARPTGALRVAEPVAESAARTATTIAGMSALALTAVAFAAASGWWLLRRLLGPVHALRAAAERLGQGDFTVQVPATGLPEVDEVGRALALSGARIGRLVERERAFSADASHQLRTPVAAVMLALETELLAPRPDRRTVLHECLAALTRLERTIDDLLRLARDETGQRAAVALCELINDAQTDWLPRYRSDDRLLGVRCRDIPDVHTSGAAVRHIVDVLLDNALRHGSGQVTLAADPTPGGVALTVTDEGPGPEHLQTLFRRRDPEATSTGIGLALARSLAEAEGSRLRLRSRDPTVFELLIPVSAAGTEDEADRPTGWTSPAAAQRRPPRPPDQRNTP